MESDFYDKFYSKIKAGGVHSRFCEYSYGIDLCQHGFADIRQLTLAMRAAKMNANHAALDVGCGTGMITEYLSDRTGASFTGIDNCAAAIDRARIRTAGKTGRLRFEIGDVNDLSLSPSAFDRIFLIDTIYFSNDCRKTISRLKQSLKRDGMLLLYYSIGPALLGMADFPVRLLEPDKTPLAQALADNGFRTRHHDVTSQELELAKRREEFLLRHKEEFEAEGIGFIHENRLADSQDDIKYIAQGIFRRYLYVAELERRL